MTSGLARIMLRILRNNLSMGSFWGTIVLVRKSFWKEETLILFGTEPAEIIGKYEMRNINYALRKKFQKFQFV